MKKTACSSSACRTAWPRAVTASGRWRRGEVALRSFGRRLRTLIPECNDADAAGGGLVARAPATELTVQ